MPSAPAFSCLSISCRSTPWAPEENPRSCTTASLRPSRSTRRPRTVGTSIFSRSTRTLRVSLAPGEKTSSFTLVPAGPLMRPVASVLLMPAIECPSTSRIRSPFWMPAPAAGAPLKASSTRSPRSSFSTVMPTPSNSPVTASWKALASLGEM